MDMDVSEERLNKINEIASGKLNELILRNDVGKEESDAIFGELFAYLVFAKVSDQDISGMLEDADSSAANLKELVLAHINSEEV